MPQERVNRLALWPVALALAVAVAIGGMYSLSSLSTKVEWSKHTEEVRVAISELRSTLLDAETGARGYLITGEPTFLEPYDHALTTWQPELDQLTALTVDNPGQQLRLAQLQQVLGARLASLQTVKSAYDAGRRDAELAAAMRDDKRVMDSVRGILADMQREEERLDRTRVDSTERRWSWTMALFVGGVVALVLVILAIWLQRRGSDAKRLRAEDALRAHELFRVVLEEVDMGITVQDRTGALRYANQAAAELVGFDSPQELVAANPNEVVGRFEIFHADGTPFPFDQLPSRKALDGERTEETMLRFKTRGARSERWSLLHSIPVRDPEGAVVLALNFFREVTQKTREDQQRTFLLRITDELTAARDYETTLANVARLSVPAIADWCAIDLVAGDRTRRVELAHIDPAKLTFVAELERRYPSNPSATTGVPAIIRTGQPEMMADIPHARLVAAAIDDKHRKLIERLEIRSYIGVPLRVRGKTIGALTLVMAESGRRFTDDDLRFAQAVADRAALAIDNARLLKEVEDANAHIGDQLVAESERRAAAENTSRFAETFIGILGHDLRNPLNAVTMAAAVLRQKTDLVHGKTIDRIEASATRMSNMVTQLLDLTRSRLGGGIVLDKGSCDLGAVISDVIDELQLAHGGRTIRWDKREFVGHWDSDRLAQVVSNLVGNALEHGDPNQPVEVSLETMGSGARFTVRSRGKVIAQDLIAVLFDPYRQAALRGARSRGLGLGLFISQQIVLAHDGQIDVTSTDDHTTFTVTLPGVADEKLAEAPALRIQSS